MLPTTHPGPTPGSRVPAIFIFLFFLIFIIYVATQNQCRRIVRRLRAPTCTALPFVTVFGIVLSIYDLFGVRRGQCACKYPHPIMPAVFVRLLPSLRGVDEGRGVGWRGVGLGGAVCFFCCFFSEFHLHTHACTHIRAPICAPRNPFRLEGKKNCTFICIRIIDTSN